MIRSTKRSPDGDEVRGNGLKWRNKTTVMHFERRGRKFFQEGERKKAGKAKRWFSFFFRKYKPQQDFQ